jgi:hypothetical protein
MIADTKADVPIMAIPRSRNGKTHPLFSISWFYPAA